MTSLKSNFSEINVRLSEVAAVRTGYTFREKLHEDREGDLAVIQMKDIDDSNLLHFEALVRVRMPNLSDRHVVRKGDVLFRSRGSSYGTAVVTEDLGRAVLSAPMLIIRPNTDVVDPGYLQWFINHPETQAELTNRAAGSAVKMISKAVLEHFPISIPELSTQRKIAELGRLVQEEATLSGRLLEKRRQLMERILMSHVEGHTTNDGRETDMRIRRTKELGQG